MEDSNGIDPVVRQRLLNVLEYIEEVEKLSRSIPFQVEDHKRDKFYEDDLAGLPGIRFDADPESQAWLEIKRLQPKGPPLPRDETLASLVRISDDPRKQPTLAEEALQGETGQANGFEEEEVGRLKTAFDAYLTGPHRQWASFEGPRRKTIQIYAALFGLKLAMEVDSASDPIELIWGVGISLWQAQEKTVKYPILLQSVEIDIDERSHSLLVRPRNRELQVELAPFSALQNPGVQEARKGVASSLEGLNCSFSPFAPASFEGALRSCIKVLDPAGEYWERPEEGPSKTNLPTSSEQLRITSTWVLFVRPKTTHFLVQDIERLKSAAQQLGTLPPGPHAIFKDALDTPPQFIRIPFRGISSPNPAPVGAQNPRDLYFPKPYNQEQVRIVESLEQAPGVVAQGPPGTGKTHTIANIICHYLASGKSVLVTSKGEQALRVLKEKLPKDIKPLAVSLLSSDRQALQEMGEAVDNILHRTQQIDPDVQRCEIEAGRRKVDETCASVARIEGEIREWAYKYLKRVEYQGRALMPAELAEILVREREQHSWLPGPVSWTSADVNIGEEQVERFRTLRRKVEQRLQCLNWTLPDRTDIPGVEELGQIHQAIAKQQSLDLEAEAEGLPQTRPNSTARRTRTCRASTDCFSAIPVTS